MVSRAEALGLATPLVAGLVADAQQRRKSAFGFINPLITGLRRAADCSH